MKVAGQDSGLGKMSGTLMGFWWIFPSFYHGFSWETNGKSMDGVQMFPLGLDELTGQADLLVPTHMYGIKLG